MFLRGIEFGNVFNASGARGFFGEGYPFHRYWKKFGLDFSGSTFISKTTTLNPRLDPSKKEGNMPLKKDGITPQEFNPECIYVGYRGFVKGFVLNAVGLSGPGAKALLADGRWQLRREPFLISFMSVANSAAERLMELKEFIELLKRYKAAFKSRFGLEINFSCPNVGLHLDELMDEVDKALLIASELDVPLVAKFNLLLSSEQAWQIAAHPLCDAIDISNTVPWGQLGDRINWKGLFGTTDSPLAKFGGGGLSGAPLLPLVCNWITKTVNRHGVRGITKPIIAGGGILGPHDPKLLFEAGASAVSAGSIAILRPWRVHRTIQAARRYVPDKTRSKE